MDPRVNVSVRQFAAAWQVMCAACPGRQVETRGGTEYIFSGLPIPFFNVVVPTGPRLSAEALATQGREAVGWAADKGVPWFLVITHDLVDDGVDAAAVLAGCELAPALPLTGMIAADVAAGAARPADVALAVPQDDAGCVALIDINGAAYAMDLSAAHAAMGHRGFWKDHVPVLGTVGDAAVSGAAVLIVDGHRYVAMVATDPAYQRRGYAEAAMRHALAEAAAAHGPLPTVLHATDAGRPIYARMGYAAVSTHTLFMPKALMGEH
jgi:GNAT superfamily N-acetyltransferase